MTGAIDRLTEKQRVCLRMVWQHRESKEIARELGISPHSVDGRIKTAMRTLGVDDRYEAARLVVASETDQPLIYPPSDIPQTYDPAATSLSFTPGERQGEHLAFEEAQAVYRLSPSSTARHFSLPLPGDGRETNDLDTKKRLFWIAQIAIGTALAFGALAASLTALSRFA